MMKMRKVKRAVGVVALAVITACGGPTEPGLESQVRAALQAGDTKTAVIKLRDYLQGKPESGRGRLLLAIALQQAGAWVDAETEYGRALERDQPRAEIVPALVELGAVMNKAAEVIRLYGAETFSDPAAQVRLLTALAQCYAMTGQPDAALNSLSQALQLLPQHVPALALQLRLAADAQDPAATRAAAADLAQRYPQEFDAQALIGDVLSSSDPAAAIAAYDRALAIRPHSLAVNSALTLLLLRGQDIAKARSQAAKMQKVLAGSPAASYFVALAAYTDKDYLASREALQPLLGGSSGAIGPVALLAGMTELRLGQLSLADFLLSKAVATMPGNLDAARELAVLLVSRGQPERALLALKPALAGDSKDPDVHATAGQAYALLRNFKAADAAFAQALRLRPDHTPTRIQQAQSLFLRGQADAGLQALRKLTVDTGSFDADLALVRTMLAQKDSAAALKHLESVSAREPKLVAVDMLRAQVQESAGDRAGARKSYEVALEKDPRQTSAREKLAELDMAEGRRDAAKKGHLEVLKRDPRAVSAMFALANLSRLDGEDPAKSTAWLEKAVSVNPADTLPWLQAVSYFRLLDDRATGLVWAQRAAAALPANTEVLAVLGQTQLGAGQSQQAIRSFGQVVSLQPQSALARLQWAQAYVADKNLPAARAQLSRALEIDPNSRPAHWANVLLFGLEGEQNKGLAVARKMQQQWPNDTAGWLAEAELAQRQRDWTTAATALRKAVALQPRVENAVMLHAVLTVSGKKDDVAELERKWLQTYPDDLVFIGHVAVEAEQRGDQALAEAQYKRALVLRPDAPPVLNNLADLYVRQKKPQALELAERAVKLAPGVPAFMDTLSRAQAAAGKLDVAVQTQSQAVALAPRAGELRLQLARLHLERGEKDKATKELRTLVELGSVFSGQAEVQRLLKQLGS